MRRCNTATFLFFIVLAAVVFRVSAFAETEGKMSAQNSFQDDGGRTIRVEKPFKRIISLYPAHTVNLFALGLDDEIVGVSRGDDYPPEAAEKKQYSAQDGPEKFLAARPDLVLVRPMLDRGYAPLIKKLEQFGIAVVSLQPAYVEEMFDYWRKLGLMTGKLDRAEAMVEKFQRGIEKVRELVGPLEKKDRKRVYFEAIHSKMKTFAAGAMPLFALEEAGGINVAAGVEPVREGILIAFFGKERILSLAGEIDVYLAQYGAMNRPTVNDIENEPGFSVIKAVREKEVYLVEEKLISRPTMRLLEAITQIGAILYPEIFNDRAVAEILSAMPSAESEVSSPR